MSDQMIKPFSTAVTDTIQSHVSIRRYRSEPIPEEMLRTILNTARRAPTSSNVQAYSIIVIRDPEQKQRLSELSGNQQHTVDAGVLLAICADLHRLQIGCNMHGIEPIWNMENFLVATIDAALVAQNIVVAAESFGLGTAMNGGMRNHPQETAEMLGLPERVYVTFGISIGWPDQEKIPPQKPRLPEDLVIHYETYRSDDPREEIREHDKELAKHYKALGRNLHESAWSGVMASKFTQPRRAHMRKALDQRGFKFD